MSLIVLWIFNRSGRMVESIKTIKRSVIKYWLIFYVNAFCKNNINNSINTNKCLLKCINVVIFRPSDHLLFIIIYSERCLHRNKKQLTRICVHNGLCKYEHFNYAVHRIIISILLYCWVIFLQWKKLQVFRFLQ